MTTEIWLTLAAANFVAYLAPGQNIALVGTATARAGLSGGLAATGGILLAEFVWTAIALALTLTAQAVDPSALLMVQIGGGAFLVWSGYKVLRAQAGSAPEPTATSDRPMRLAIFGAWIGLANPLALVFFVSIFPGLVATSADQPALELLALCGSAVVLSSFAAMLPYLAASQALVRAGQARLLNAMSGGALLIIGLGALAWTAA